MWTLRPYGDARSNAQRTDVRRSIWIYGVAAPDGCRLSDRVRMRYAAQVAHGHAALFPALVSRCALHLQNLAGRAGAVVDVDCRVGIHHQRFVGIKFLRERWLREAKGGEQRAQADHPAPDARIPRSGSAISDAQTEHDRRHCHQSFGSRKAGAVDAALRDLP